MKDITRWNNNGGEKGDMALVDKEFKGTQTKIVERAKQLLFDNQKPILDFTGIIKGFIALEDLGLYNLEDNVSRSTNKIDLDIELYDMEEL